MKRERKGLTPQEHWELGSVISEFRTRMMCSRSPVWNRYNKTSRQVRLLDRMLRALDNFKSAMDDAVCGEYRDFQQATRVYYGREWDRNTDKWTQEQRRQLAEWLEDTPDNLEAETCLRDTERRLRYQTLDKACAEIREHNTRMRKDKLYAEAFRKHGIVAAGAL